MNTVLKSLTNLHFSVTAPPSMTSTLSCRISAAGTRCRQLTAAITTITVLGLQGIILALAQSDLLSPVIIHCFVAPFLELFVELYFYLTQFLPQLFF